MTKITYLPRQVEKTFTLQMDQRLLDLATEPNSFVSLDDYRKWQGEGALPYLGHLWQQRQVRDSCAASWQDACREHGVTHSSEEGRQLHLELLRKWGVTIEPLISTVDGAEIGTVTHDGRWITVEILENGYVRVPSNGILSITERLHLGDCCVRPQSRLAIELLTESHTLTHTTASEGFPGCVITSFQLWPLGKAP